LVVRQISGAIAKRIVCPVKPGAVFSKGEIYGMIKFGSRTELFFPASSDFELKVKIGDRVHAGTSIMAEIKNKAN
jgi:phosphatidylserine decarboxylase